MYLVYSETRLWSGDINSLGHVLWDILNLTVLLTQDFWVLCQWFLQMNDMKQFFLSLAGFYIWASIPICYELSHVSLFQSGSLQILCSESHVFLFSKASQYSMNPRFSALSFWLKQLLSMILTHSELFLENQIILARPRHSSFHFEAFVPWHSWRTTLQWLNNNGATHRDNRWWWWRNSQTRSSRKSTICSENRTCLGFWRWWFIIIFQQGRVCCSSIKH